MNPREVLGLPNGPFDLVTLRRAYATQLRLHRPDEDPEGFRRVRTAYELLSAMAAGPLRGRASLRGGAVGFDAATSADEPAWPAEGLESDGRPPTPVRPAVGRTADAVLDAWLRGETSAALGGVAALAAAGAIEEVERLALRTLEDPSVQAHENLGLLAVAVARVAALVRPDLAARLEDLAWRHATPDERRLLDLPSIDLRRIAARDIERWPVAARRVMLRAAAGERPPPVPMPADWDGALGRIGRLLPESSTLAWLAAEAPEVLAASGALYFLGRGPRPPRRRAVLRTPIGIIVLIWGLVAGLSKLALKRPDPGGFEDPSTRWSAEDHFANAALAEFLEALADIGTTPPPDAAQARAAFARLTANPKFAALIRDSVTARAMYTATRRRYLPAGEALDDPLLRARTTPPR